MEFNSFHKAYFSAERGAYSRVTDRERKDSQITLTDVEADIVIDYFGIENIHVGGKKSNPEMSAKTFFLNSELKPITLNLVFPKPKNKELRLYLSKGAGFLPEGGEIWFIYVNNHNLLVIGSMDEKIWNLLGQADIEDENYQHEIEEALLLNPAIPEVAPVGRISTTVRGAGIMYQRNPRIAIVRFRQSQYKCEIDPEHNTFIAEKTNLPYVEAHHFIPMKFQPNFDIPLDDFDNITSLCPNCHRGIHLGIAGHREFLVKSLYDIRPQLHRYSFETIAQYYNCFKLPA